MVLTHIIQFAEKTQCVTSLPILTKTQIMCIELGENVHCHTEKKISREIISEYCEASTF